MIVVSCDICGETISESAKMVKPTDNFPHLFFPDICQKCKDAWEGVNQPRLVKLAILDNRLDIPREKAKPLGKDGKSAMTPDSSISIPVGELPDRIPWEERPINDTRL